MAGSGLVWPMGHTGPLTVSISSRWLKTSAAHLQTAWPRAPGDRSAEVAASGRLLQVAAVLGAIPGPGGGGVAC